MAYSISEIQKKLSYFKELFDPEKSTYPIIRDIADNKYTPEEALDKLLTIDNMYEMPKNVQDYYDIILNDLKNLVDDRKKVKLREELLKQASMNIESNLHDRKIDLNANTLEQHEENDTQAKQQAYINNLSSENNKLDNVNQSLKKEKEVGQKFDDKFVQSTLTYGNQLEKINEEALNNVKIVVNPSVADLRNYVNFYKSNQRDDQTFNIRINGSPSQRSIELFYKGYNVNEKISKVVFEYTSEEAFDSKAIYEIVMLYANDAETLSSTNENNKYVNVSSNGDTLEINDMPVEFTDNVDKNINEMQKDDQLLYDKRNVKKLVRKLDDVASAEMLKIFVLIVIIFVILVVFLLIRR